MDSVLDRTGGVIILLSWRTRTSPVLGPGDMAFVKVF